ncbi:MAG: hypothetical protein ACYC6G_02225 [Desulfobaccales bacterium]
MKVLFITAVQDLIISENLGKGDKISPELLITNDSSLVKELITSEFSTLAGTIETHFILKSDLIIYGKYDVNDKDFVAQDYLLRKIITSKFFLNLVWLLRDNSVNFEMGFLQYIEPQGVRVDTNYISAIYSNCHGKREKITLSRDELKLARKIFRERFSNEPIELQKGTRLHKGIKRVEIVFYFLQSARSNPDLAVKVVDYCTCFEALCSTSNAELSHQLAERVAFFIGENFDERRDIFNKIKEAYGIRSRIIHGDLLSPSKIDRLYAISETCDNFLRRILYKIISDDELSNIFSAPPAQLDDYFLSIILK